MVSNAQMSSARKEARRTIKKRARNLGMESLEVRLVLDSTVVFNEIMYNPPAENDDGLEWIELYNQLAANMDISEWRLDGGVRYTFPDKTVVPGRGYLVVASDPEAFTQQTGVPAVGPLVGRLDNRGEELLLFNNDERLMNSVDYRDGGEWPTAPDGSGATLAKARERTASDVAESWTFSPQPGGTPGAANFLEPGSFQYEIFLDEGAEVRAVVPLDPSLGEDWIQPGFDDSAWTVGTTGVGYDNGRNPTYKSLLGLDLDEPPNGQAPTPLQNVNQSLFIRTAFDVGSDLSDVDVLKLKMKYDDGFVAYINGLEVASDNAPGRDGDTSALAWFSASTGSHSDREAVRFIDFDLTTQMDKLVQGRNVLAIHGLNRSVSDDDLLFVPQIVAGREVEPESRLAVAINEVASGNAENFWLELSNQGNEPVALGGFVLVASGQVGGEYVLPAQTLPVGGLLALTEQDLGFRAIDGDRLFLYSAGKEDVVDGRPVTGRLRGRSAELGGRWLYPDVPTPGAANSFQLQSDVVINEIMFHAPPEHLVQPAIPPTYVEVGGLALDAAGWRYRQTAAPLPADWASTTHGADGAEWLAGQGPLGFVNAQRNPDLAAQMNTELDFPALQVPPFITYYFENDFDIPATDNPVQLQLSHLINGGAVFYLNGVEFDRFNMPAGDFNADTPSSGRVRRVGLSDPIVIPPEIMVAGTNRLSVEVHRESLTAIDIVMGAQIVVREQVDAGAPVKPFVDSDEEWIELYNRGSAPVDLTGWTIADAVRFEFSPGTILGPGQYLVVANDAAKLAAKYSSSNIVGDFTGGLNNHDDRIELVDANRNPADEVHYYEGGRWPAYTDGGRSSLELRNPHADNSKAEAWAASDESGKSQWQTYTFREFSFRDVTATRPLFNEFIFGLLEAGEFLMDDIEVIEDPDGASVPLIQNGTFQADTLGQAPATWRLLGTHPGTVVLDPDNPQNQVLHIVADGPGQHIHDHAETTFIDERPILEDGTEYEFTFRVKWLAGNNQLNTRLFFHRAPNTTYLEVPELIGTPGAQNSTYEANIGPTYSAFGHAPAMPGENQEVTVSVQAEDPSGVSSMTLWWRLDGGDWNSVAMSAAAGGFYGATIPGHSSGDIIQFYVEGEDGQGAGSTFPAAGPDSRALVQVQDEGESRKPNDIIDTFRLIMLADDQRAFYDATNNMSNHFVPITMVHNNDVYHDVSVRQIGSRWIRPNSGYKVRLHPDNLFYGVHDSIRFDINNLAEVVMKQMLSRAGGSKASMYDDIAYLVAPARQRGHTGVFLLQLARYENIFLDEQFQNGSSGTKWELDDVTYPTGPRGGPEGLKTGTGVNQNADFGVSSRLVYASQHDDREFYRGHVLIKSQRTKDDFESIINLTKAIHLTPEEGLYEATQEVMDVDLWMRHFAHQAYLGNWDTYGFRRPKNLRVYLRPEDNKTVPLFWDCDLCNFTEPIYNRRENLSRLDEIRDIPANLRLFWGHMLDMINRSFNEEYVAPWAAHFGELTGNDARGGDENFRGIARSTGTRSAQALSDMENPSRGGIPRVSFQITTDAANVSPTDGMVTLGGTGWIDIRQMRLSGSDQPLQVQWTSADTWELALPVGVGENLISLDAIDYQGNLIATESISVTSTVANPVSDSLRISEINYNPYTPTSAELAVNGALDNDDFEFIEVQNVGAQSINLLNVRFTDGIEYQFPVTLLAPGQSGVLVKNTTAFPLRYGTGVNVLGQFAQGSLNNAGERLTVVDGQNQTILDFEYRDGDPWPEASDGVGASLELVDPTGPAAQMGRYHAWRGSTEFGGSPGAVGRAPLGVVINEVMTNTGQAGEPDAIELVNTTSQAVDIGGWYLSDSRNNLHKFQIPAGTTIPAGGYVVFDGKQFNPTPTNPGPNHFGLSGSRGDDVWLVIPDEGGGVQAIVDNVSFGAAASGVTFGRWPNGQGRLAPMTATTLSGANAAPRASSVVISEFNHTPAQPSPAAVQMYPELVANDLEFVEVVNTSSSTVDLTEWRIRGGVDFDFAAGATLGPGAVALIVSFNPDASNNTHRINAFREHYDLAQNVMLVGGYQGQLSDIAERLVLQRPGDPPADAPFLIPRIMEDEVVYDTMSPWPTEASGTGSSLTRAALGGWGTAPESWTAATATPGSAAVTAIPEPGDSNMDGVFNQLDIVAVLQAGKFMTGQPATFAEGDWNGDGVFNQLDIVRALQAGNYQTGNHGSVVNALAGDSLSKSEADEEAVDAVFGGMS